MTERPAVEEQRDTPDDVLHAFVGRLAHVERLEAQLDAWRMMAALLAGHLSAAINSDSARVDGLRACCPDCALSVERYIALRDGKRQAKFDPTTTTYAGDPRQR